MSLRALLAIGTLLCACAPVDVADKIGRRAADTVVRPIVAEFLPAPDAESATRCIVDNGSAAEIQQLSRDVGVMAGTSTVDLVYSMVRNPATAQCLKAAGLPSIGQVAL
jgi:hypothetical protein